MAEIPGKSKRRRLALRMFPMFAVPMKRFDLPPGLSRMSRMSHGIAGGTATFEPLEARSEVHFQAK